MANAATRDPGALPSLQARHEVRAVTLGVIAELPGTALLTPKEAAVYLATSPDVLRTWRATGRGPRFKGRGHFIRYQKAMLDEFMSAHDRE
jgi:Helix-turn-helix domain